MRSAPLGRHRDTDVRQYSTSVHLTPRENSSLNYKLLSLSKYYLATGWLTLCGLGVAWELPGAQSVSVHMNPKFFCWKSLMLLIMMNSIKCDRLTRDTREWQKRECHLHTLNEGRKGSESREQLRNPRHPVWQWPWHVTRGGVTADQGRAGQMCLHSAWTVIATLLSLTSSLSWASHILWQDGILRNYGNVAQMSLCHCNWDSLSHTCHPHIILTFYCQTQPDLLMLCPFQIMFSILIY